MFPTISIPTKQILKKGKEKGKGLKTNQGKTDSQDAQIGTRKRKSGV